MTNEELIQKKQETADEFDLLDKQRLEILDKQKTLQGKYQAYEEMAQTLETLAPNPSTIVVKEAKSGK